MQEFDEDTDGIQVTVTGTSTLVYVHQIQLQTEYPTDFELLRMQFGLPKMRLFSLKVILSVDQGGSG